MFIKKRWRRSCDDKGVNVVVFYEQTRPGVECTSLMAIIAPPSGFHRRVMILITIMQRKAYRLSKMSGKLASTVVLNTPKEEKGSFKKVIS